MTFFIIYEVKNSAFHEDKTDTNCADVVSLGGAPKLSPQRRIRRDARRGEQFGEGEREQMPLSPSIFGSRMKLGTRKTAPRSSANTIAGRTRSTLWK